MTGEFAVTFGSLLRHLRTEFGLTQEELAESAQLSVRAISDLERGVNATARKKTASLLADALKLVGQGRAAFEAAARGRVPSIESWPSAATPPSFAAATRTLPRDIVSFTGRELEIATLLAKARIDNSAHMGHICAIGGMAGIGKTALAVHAAHTLAPSFPGGQIFMPLHGHTPGKRPVEPDDALASLLLTVGIPPSQIPSDAEARTRMWRDHLATAKLILVLDDAISHAQIRPLLPGLGESLVLVTSRRLLTALEDAEAINLDILPPDKAAELLVRLAGRTELRADDQAVRNIADLCGHLPLAIGMLGRQLHLHPARQCDRLAADLLATRNRLAYMYAENLSVAAAFDMSYEQLSEQQQRLFRRLGIDPGPDIDAYAAAALDGIDLATARRSIDALYEQYLLSEPEHGRYRMHDLIREHASTLATTDPPEDREQAIARLTDYYLHTGVSIASRFVDRRSPGYIPSLEGSGPTYTPELLTRDAAATWLSAERLNLLATASYAAAHGAHTRVIVASTAMHSYLRRNGYWDQALELHEMALGAGQAVGDSVAVATALTDRGDLEHVKGDYAAARASLMHALDLCRQAESKLGEASALNELGVVNETIGDYGPASECHRKALELYRYLGDQFGEAGALDRLGVVQHSTGDFAEAANSHQHALDLYRELGYQRGEAGALNRLGAVQRSTGDYLGAVASHQLALRIYREIDYRLGEAGALNRLAEAQWSAHDHPNATATAVEALRLNRELRHRVGEAHALHSLGRVQRSTGQYAAAVASQEKALEIYRDLGHRNGEARALRELSIAQRFAGDLLPAASNLARAEELYRELGIPVVSVDL